MGKATGKDGQIYPGGGGDTADAALVSLHGCVRSYSGLGSLLWRGIKPLWIFWDSLMCIPHFCHIQSSIRGSGQLSLNSDTKEELSKMFYLLNSRFPGIPKASDY